MAVISRIYGAIVQRPGYRIVAPEIGVRLPVASPASSADIAQPEERDHAMVEAAGSNPAVRFIHHPVRRVAKDTRF